MALNHAAALGFAKSPMGDHADLGLATTWFYIALSTVFLFTCWRRISWVGGKGWILFLLGLVGIVLLIVTAYLGGYLVYRIGVNVLPVKP